MSLRTRKVAVVIPKYGLVGGAERFALELTERIAQNKQYDVHVFANRWIRGSDCIAFHKVPIIAFPKFLAPITFAYFAGHKISKLGFDLVHTHERIFDADVFTMHGIPHGTWVREIRRKRPSIFDHATEWVEKVLVESDRCAKFLSVSSLAQDKFLQAYNTRADKAMVIHPGVDIPRFQRLDRRLCRQEVRSLFNIGESDVVVLFVSMNFEIKGLDSLMAALARIIATTPCNRLKLLVAGKGDRKKYGRLAETLGIRRDVVFAGVQRNNIERVFLACDVFAMLSKFDTFGMTTLEAMAASLPVIISANVGARDLVREGENGFVIGDRNDIDAVARKIGLMLNPDARLAMAQQAFRTALDHTWEAAAKRMQDIYEEVIHSDAGLSKCRAGSKES